jgi:hypothetical protein
MVDLGKSASKIAQRQSTRLKSRAKSRTKSAARAKVRQVQHGVTKEAKDKLAAQKAGRADNSELTAVEDETIEIENLDEAAPFEGSHSYPTSNVPLGFKPPRGLKLINDPDEIPEPFDWSKVPWKKIAIAIALLIVIPLLVVSLRWGAPKIADLVRSAEVAVPAVPTIPTVPTATTEAPVVVITTWGEGTCVTTATDGTARPSSCTGADYEVTSSIAYPDLELTPDEVREVQELMGSLGVPVGSDGVLGSQTRIALNSFAAAAGLDPSANDRAKVGAVRAATLTGGLAGDGPRLIQSSPEFCGDGLLWVDDLTQIHCLAPL